MIRLRCCASIPGISCVLLLSAGTLPLRAQTPPPIKFEVPAVVDPIHTNGEPDIGIDVFGRVFVSGPTGTGTQRSTWFGSVDRGHTFRIISPGLPPNAITGLVDPPGGGDTAINFDRSAKQYFVDLYALICDRTATTSDGGATVMQSIAGGCADGTAAGSDRPWLAVYDPPPSIPRRSAYTGQTPLVYLERCNHRGGAQRFPGQGDSPSHALRRHLTSACRVRAASPRRATVTSLTSSPSRLTTPARPRLSTTIHRMAWCKRDSIRPTSNWSIMPRRASSPSRGR